MENPLLLSPQLNTASKVKSLYKIMKSMNKDGDKPETKCRTQEKRNRLSLLQKPELHPNVDFDKFEKLTKASRLQALFDARSHFHMENIDEDYYYDSVSPKTVKTWGESFDMMISQKAGLDAFTRFLRSEFSEENIEFWMACEDYKKIKDTSQLSQKAKTIYETFIEKEAPKEVNLDFNTKVCTSQSMSHPTLTTFDAAQTKIYALMEQDCYPRFLKSNLYIDLVHGRPPGCSALRRRSRSFTFNEFKDAQPDFAIWL